MRFWLEHTANGVHPLHFSLNLTARSGSILTLSGWTPIPSFIRNLWRGWLSQWTAQWRQRSLLKWTLSRVTGRSPWQSGLCGQRGILPVQVDALRITEHSGNVTALDGPIYSRSTPLRCVHWWRGDIWNDADRTSWQRGSLFCKTPGGRGSR